MKQSWFVVEAEQWDDKEILLPVDESYHAIKVLRVAPPDVITITDGRGKVAKASVTRIDGDRVAVEILEAENRRRLKPELVVYQGAAKGQKVDDAIERLAELGVAEVWVYESQRSVVHWNKEKLDRLSRRWRAIARSASKQSRNPFMLRTGGGLSWTQLLRKVSQEPYAVVLWEEGALPLRTALIEGAERVALVVGPEGGLARNEAEALADAGCQVVSLGPLILRTENAPVVAAAAVLYHYGLIG
ncbi:MAG: RsmE family RNA methyltransferase [Actinomycetota bacterium]|nr:16S rRNA (uracil(1498)-N(3))-methyltransferase [Actinomycetota bacterium]